MEEEKPRNWWQKIKSSDKRNWLIAVLFLMVLTQYLKVEGAMQTSVFLQDRDSSLVEEIGQIKDSYAQLGGDINEVKQFLRLPTKSYELTELNSEEEGNDLEVALFQYASYLSSSKQVNERLVVNQEIFEELKRNGDFRNYVSALDLSLKVQPDEIVVMAGTLEIARINLDQETGYIQAVALDEQEKFKEDNFDDLAKEVKNYLKDNERKLKKTQEELRNLKAKIEGARKSQKIQNFLSHSGATIDAEAKENSDEIYYAVTNKDEDFVGKIVIDKKELKIYLVDLYEGDLKVEVNDLDLSLLPFLEKLDTKSLIEHKANAAQITVEQTIFDEAFQLLLREAGLRLDEKPREDASRIYYDIYKGQQKNSSIVIEKSSGVVNIVRPDGTGAENVLFFDPDFKKKTLEIPENLPQYSDELNSADTELNILVAGKHGELVDTMIFAHIDEKNRSIDMISIPRDLQYKGRKINSYPFYYGMPELVKVIGEITGYELDKYILVDMYAFIEVVDLLGGVDVTLQEAVIDPTYKTVDNGVEGTLHFEAGDHHVSGVEALRLARSRYTSSDFARSARQQMILRAIKEKAQNFGLGDADTIYKIAESVLKKTESDISLDEAVAYYFRYQNYEIESMDVMSTANVLYSPPYITAAQCQALIAAAAARGEVKPGCENDNHAYLLLPENNDWNVIKWFFEQRFE